MNQSLIRSILERFEVRQFRVVDRFVEDGKLSILVKDHHCNLLISEAIIYELKRFRDVLMGKSKSLLIQDKENLQQEVNESVHHPLKRGHQPAKQTNATNKSYAFTPEKNLPHPKHKVSPGKGGLGSIKYSPVIKQVKIRTPSKLCPHPKEVITEQSLSPQQREVVTACVRGENVFYSGGAGKLTRLFLIQLLKLARNR